MENLLYRLVLSLYAGLCVETVVIATLAGIHLWKSIIRKERGSTFETALGVVGWFAGSFTQRFNLTITTASKRVHAMSPEDSVGQILGCTTMVVFGLIMIRGLTGKSRETTVSADDLNGSLWTVIAFVVLTVIVLTFLIS